MDHPFQREKFHFLPRGFPEVSHIDAVVVICPTFSVPGRTVGLWVVCVAVRLNFIGRDGSVRGHKGVSELGEESCLAGWPVTWRPSEAIAE